MTIRSGLVLVALIAATPTATTFAQGSGADAYKYRCVLCHGADGLGSTPTGKMMHAASFNSPEAIKASDAVLIATIKGGKGRTMPAYGAALTDTQIKDIVAYIRTLQRK